MVGWAAGLRWRGFKTREITFVQKKLGAQGLRALCGMMPWYSTCLCMDSDTKFYLSNQCLASGLASFRQLINTTVLTRLSQFCNYPQSSSHRLSPVLPT